MGKEHGMASNDRKVAKAKAMRQIDRLQAILRKWDPIGVQPGEFAPADEYDSYAPHIVSLVARGCSVAELTRHMEELRTGIIGVEANPERDHEIAAEIVEALRGDAFEAVAIPVSQEPVESEAPSSENIVMISKIPTTISMT